MENFKNIRHFSPSEFDHPEKMNPELLQRLDAFREYIKRTIIITSSTGGVHASKSQHYLGNAVDIIVPQRKGSLMALWMIAERFNFTGIGVYPDWEYNSKVCGGLHLDMRPENKFHGSRWIGMKKINQQTGQTYTDYLPLSTSYLKRCRILT